ncbi:MAG: hypothetical protein SNI58_09430 [Rikenellaceae bacterium]
MKKIYISIVALAATITVTNAQTQVEVNLNVRHKLGEVDSFDRQKFINFHATHDEKNWDQDNDVKSLRDELLVKYDVYLGRDTGGIKHTLESATQDPSRPGFVDPAYIAKEGAKARKEYAKDKESHKYEKYSEAIICNQFSPFYPHGTTLKHSGWALSHTNSQSEPFGTASGEYYGRYIKEFFGQGGKSGKPRPTYCEVINEPLWDLYDMPNAPRKGMTDLFRFHSTVAKEVRKYNPGILVGGYCTAFPDFDVDNFVRWDQRWKSFIDIAGEDMDFFTIHLYDFPCHPGLGMQYRKGSNVEATMDMLEQYSMLRLGETKPLMISEYGAQTHKYNHVWSPYRDWLRIKSTNSMMMQFMERADKINIAMPFLMLKSEWAYIPETNKVHQARMMRRENEPDSFTGDYIFADAFKFYQLWVDVNGTRVDSTSDNLDIMCDAYVDGDMAYVIINNLDFEAIDIDLNIRGNKKNPSSIEVRQVYLEGGEGGTPILDVKTVKSIDKIRIEAEATCILCYKYKKEVVIDELNEEVKYYATDYMKPISANETIPFEINDIKLGKYGEATLRLGVGREHGKVLYPEVYINGHKAKTVTNHRGDEQIDRKGFFGVIEIPVSYKNLSRNNSISIKFPDNGGYVTTATMQVFNFSDNIRK